MPTPLVTATLAFAAILTAVSGPVGAIVGGLALAFQLVVATENRNDGLR